MYQIKRFWPLREKDGFLYEEDTAGNFLRKISIKDYKKEQKLEEERIYQRIFMKEQQRKNFIGRRCYGK